MDGKGRVLGVPSEIYSAVMTEVKPFFSFLHLFRLSLSRATGNIGVNRLDGACYLELETRLKGDEQYSNEKPECQKQAL